MEFSWPSAAYTYWKISRRLYRNRERECASTSTPAGDWGMFLTICLLFGVANSPVDATPPRANPVVLIRTEKGDIEIELEADKAPATVANFLRYVDAGFYDGGQFHRSVKPDNQPDNAIKIEVIQAGINPDKAKQEFPPIKL